MDEAMLIRFTDFQTLGMRILPYLLLMVAGYCAKAQDATTTLINIVGCHNQHDPAPSLAFMADSIQPDFTLWVGDNVYADTRDDASHIEKQLRILEGKPGFAKLRERSKFYVTWDDHDYGLNNAGKEYRLKEQSKQIHRRFWQLEEEIPEDRNGVYYSKVEVLPNGKRLQFIMLDIRYNRDKPGRNGDPLGEAQWKWLEKQLSQPADLRFVVSGFQILLNKPTRWEAWIKFGGQRKRLFELIETTAAKGVVFVTGDQHYVEVLRRKGVMGYDAYEIMAAGINKNERPGRARCRVAGPDITIHSAPLITVDWAESQIVFTNTDVETGAESLRYVIPFSAIGL